MCVFNCAPSKRMLRFSAASLQFSRKTNLVHVVMRQPTPDGTFVSRDALWLAYWQAFQWLWRSPCLHLAFFPLPIQSLAEPAGWASPSAFSLVPLIFLFTILLLILEFTFLFKRVIGLLEFLAFFVATDLSISVHDLLCSFPFLKGYLLASHAIFYYKPSFP